MKKFSVGAKLCVDKKYYTIIGYIIYTNPENNDESWIEYRLLSSKNEETWLSIDNNNYEYSISWPSHIENNQISCEWHKVDEGTQIVKEFAGDVDVDIGEKSEFVEHENDEEEKILSVEVWDGGSEISEGFYLDEIEIYEVNDKFQKGQGKNSKGCLSSIITIFIFLSIAAGGLDILGSSRPCNEYFEHSQDYNYVTSITGEEDTKANVYETKNNPSSTLIQDIKTLDTEMKNMNDLHADPSQIKTDEKMSYYIKDLIVQADIEAKYISQNKESGDSVGILTDEEYCLFYHPEDAPEKIYVQVSNRKFNYTSHSRPYRASIATNMWYRTHYYNSAFSSDSVKWKSTPSAYDMYNGPIVKDLGNGYYDVYSNDVRQSSVGMSRRSSSGGHSAGK